MHLYFCLARLWLATTDRLLLGYLFVCIEDSLQQSLRSVVACCPFGIVCSRREANEEAATSPASGLVDFG
jgi:hypothetical protein